MLQYACKETLVIQGDLAVVDLKGSLWFLVLQKFSSQLAKKKKLQPAFQNTAKLNLASSSSSTPNFTYYGCLTGETT